MINLDSKYLNGDFIVQKDINDNLAITLEKGRKGGYVVLQYKDGQDIVGEDIYYNLEEVAKSWGNEGWYI